MDNNSNNQSTPVTSLPPVEPQPQIPSQNPPTPTVEKTATPSIEITPEPVTQPVASPPPEIVPEPEITPAPETAPTPEVIPEPPKTAEPTLADFGIAQKPVQRSNFFKVFFIFALIIFILVGTVLAFVYFKSQKTTQDSSSKTTTTPSPSGTCLLNDKTYQVGDSFVAADGCNTCTCSSQNNISCTDNQCLSTKTSTRSATTTTTPTLVPTSPVKISTSSSEKL